MNLEDLDPIQLTRDTDLNLAVKPSRPAKGGIYCINSVRRSDHNDLTPFFQTIHHCQELGDNPTLDFSRYFLAAGCN
jgi:hypothetical protein